MQQRKTNTGELFVTRRKYEYKTYRTYIER